MGTAVCNAVLAAGIRAVHTPSCVRLWAVHVHALVLQPRFLYFPVKCTATGMIRMSKLYIHHTDGCHWKRKENTDKSQIFISVCFQRWCINYTHINRKKNHWIFTTLNYQFAKQVYNDAYRYANLISRGSPRDRLWQRQAAHLWVLRSRQSYQLHSCSFCFIASVVCLGILSQHTIEDQGPHNLMNCIAASGNFIAEWMSSSESFRHCHHTRWTVMFVELGVPASRVHLYICHPWNFVVYIDGKLFTVIALCE